MAWIEPEFERRGVKVVALSVDTVESHTRWLDDIRDTQGYAPSFPMIGDPDLKVARLYGMLPARPKGHTAGRAAADNQTVRTVFVESSPDKRIKLMLAYPMTTGRNFDEVLRVIELAAPDRAAQRVDAGELAGRRRRDHPEEYFEALRHSGAPRRPHEYFDPQRHANIIERLAFRELPDGTSAGRTPCGSRGLRALPRVGARARARRRTACSAPS